MRSRHRCSPRAGAFLLLLLLAAPAAAQEPRRPAQTSAAAVALADQGWEHYQAGRYAEALKAFRDADATQHAPPFVLMLARTHGKMGQLLEARSAYQRLVDEKLPKGESSAFLQAQADAKVELAALEPRIPTLEIVVEGTSPDALELQLDGTRTPPFTPQPCNPGTHTVTASLPGGRPVTLTLDLAEGARQRVAFDPASLAPAPPPPPPAASPARREAAPTVGSSKTLLVAGGVTAGVGVLAGVVFSVLALDEANHAENLRLRVDREQGPKGCPREGAPPVCTDLLDTVYAQYRFTDVAGAGFLAGAVGVGLTIYGLVKPPSSAAQPIQVAPMLGPKTMGLSVGGVL
jgi:tetratricopeptide (TPR) repeat protein